MAHKMSLEQFNENYKKSIFHPPLWNSYMDPLRYLHSLLAQNKVANIINSKTNLKCWIEEENGGPDIIVKDKGYIEVKECISNCEVFNFWSRNLDDYEKWKKYGDKSLIVFFDIYSGEFWFHSFEKIVSAAKTNQFKSELDTRNGTGQKYMVPKDKMKTGIKTIEEYFK